jgi:hypothetical protein
MDGLVLPLVAGTPPPGGSDPVWVIMEAYLHGVSTRKVDDVARSPLASIRASPNRKSAEFALT